MGSDRDDLAAYLDTLLDGVAWASSGAEAATHIATVLGWRPPARVIETVEELATLTFPCGIREIPAEPTEFFPAVWELGMQVGWCRVGTGLFDLDDCTPRLPVIVLWGLEEGQ